MSMNKFDDIIPPSKRKDFEAVPQTPVAVQERRASQSSRFPYITIGVIAAVILVSLGVLFYFSGAKVEIVPNSVSASIQGSFTAGGNASDLPYKIISAQKVASQSVKASGTKSVSTSASGTITVYNKQSKSQALIKNTRFATTGGLVFRIHAPVTIPGGSMDKPGSKSVTVYADKPGSTYNIGPTSFTIPGFAGTLQAELVYAQSTQSMSGGASGDVPVVDSATEATTRRALIAALEPDLLQSIKDQIPPEYVLLSGAATTTYQELQSAPGSDSGTALVKEQGTVTAVVFQNEALAKVIASSVTSLQYQGEPLTLASSSNLVLSSDALPSAEETQFNFTLSGTAPLVYSIDTARIAAAVAGKTRSAADVALTNYPEIARATLLLRPFWKQSFPEDPTAISVVVLNP